MRILFTVLILAFAGIARAETEWINPLRDTNGDVYYVRYGSFQVMSPEVARIGHLRELAAPAQGIKSSALVVEYNCETTQRRLVQATHYSGSMAKGRVMSKEAAGAWERVTRGSIGYRMLKATCG